MADIDKKIEKAIEPIVKMYSQLETELMIEISKHFKMYGEFINSDYWRIQKLNEMGAFNSKVIEFISKYTKRTPNEIKKALEEIYKGTLDIDTLRSAYKNNKIIISPNEILKDSTLRSIVNNAYNEMTNRFIQMSSLIEETTKKAYLDIVEKAYLETSTGVKSYGQTIRESLNKLAEKGIDTLDYTYTTENGSTYVRSYSIEGVVRREILTGSRQLSGNLNTELIDKTGCEYVKFSEHLDCRPTHFDWQGTIVKTEDWKKIGHYGDVTGIYGINCRHYAEPYFGDAKGDELKQYSKEDVDNAYAISQQQRYLERGLRSWKRRREIAKASDDIDMLNKSKAKVKEWTSRLDTFTKENNTRREYHREYVAKMNNALPIEKNKKKDNVLVIKSKYYDATNEWIKENNNQTNLKNNVRVFKDSEKFEYEGKEYTFDNNLIYYDWKQGEKEFADWLTTQINEEIIMIPNIDINGGVSVPDYIIKKIKYDLKTLEPSNHSKQPIFHAIEKKQKQATHFFIDGTHSEHTYESLLKEAQSIFYRNKPSWVDMIGIKKDDKFIILSKQK